MDIATFAYEKKLVENGATHVIGIDEAGRGPLAGPVVACAVALKDYAAFAYDKTDEEKQKLWNLVRDSKKLSEKQRSVAFDFVHAHFDVGVGVSTNETIDRINILEATFLAMKKALTELHKDNSTDIDVHGAQAIILVDGNKTVPHLTGNQKAITQGDQKVKSIAAASIIAKVTRDRMMMEYDAMFPAYGFAQHKGYGTKKHMDALTAHGATPIHRKSFAPVRRVL